MVLQNHRPLHREIFTDEVVLPALSHHTTPSPHKNSPSRPKTRGGVVRFFFCNPIPFRLK